MNTSHITYNPPSLEQDIVNILESRSIEMQTWHGHSPNIGVSKDDFLEIAEEISKRIVEREMGRY